MLLITSHKQVRDLCSKLQYVLDLARPVAVESEACNDLGGICDWVGGRSKVCIIPTSVRVFPLVLCPSRGNARETRSLPAKPDAKNMLDEHR